MGPVMHLLRLSCRSIRVARGGSPVSELWACGHVQLGRVIASKQGVVTAEEMAPYLDLPKGGAKRGDEGYVVPALLKFGGHPEVDQQGNLLYTFPDLQKSASASMVRLSLLFVALLYVLCKYFNQLLHGAVMSGTFQGPWGACRKSCVGMWCFRARLAALLRSMRLPALVNFV